MFFITVFAGVHVPGQHELIQGVYFGSVPNNQASSSSSAVAATQLNLDVVKQLHFVFVLFRCNLKAN